MSCPWCLSKQIDANVLRISIFFFAVSFDVTFNTLRPYELWTAVCIQLWQLQLSVLIYKAFIFRVNWFINSFSYYNHLNFGFIFVLQIKANNIIKISTISFYETHQNDCSQFVRSFTLLSCLHPTWVLDLGLWFYFLLFLIAEVFSRKIFFPER